MEKMPTFEYYFVPLVGPSVGPADVEVLGFAERQIGLGHKLRLTFYGRGANLKGLVISTPLELNDQDRQRALSEALEHTMTVLRLAHSSDINLMYGGFQASRYLNSGDVPSPDWRVTLSMEEHRPPAIAFLKGAWEYEPAWALSEPLALFAEGRSEQLPLHYRILSFYRVIEHLCPKKRDLKEFLSRFDGRFAALQVSERPFSRSMAEIRNLCAHGRLSERDPGAPLHGFGFRTPDDLFAVSKLLEEAAATCIRDVGGFAVEGWQRSGQEAKDEAR